MGGMRVVSFFFFAFFFSFVSCFFLAGICGTAQLKPKADSRFFFLLLLLLLTLQQLQAARVNIDACSLSRAALGSF